MALCGEEPPAAGMSHSFFSGTGAGYADDLARVHHVVSRMGE
jgi:hypothetical protein